MNNRSTVRASMLVLGVASLLPATATANIAAARPDSAGLDGPISLARTPLEITGETLAIECHQEAAVPVCEMTAVYTVRNPGSEPEPIVGVFYGAHVQGLSMMADGSDVSRTLTADHLSALDALVAESERGPAAGGGRRAFNSPSLLGFSMTVEPGTDVALEVRGVLRPGRTWKPAGYAMPAHYARHLVLGQRAEAAEHTLAYSVQPIKTWARIGPINVSVSYPAAWRVPASQPWTRKREGDRTTLTQTDASPDEDIHLSFILPAPLSWQGGVLLAAGGGWGDGGGFRLRGGVEVGGPDWALYTLNVDSDQGGDAVVAPMVSFATPMVLVVPSLSVGVGMPVAVRDGAATGVRTAAELHLGPVGFAASWDVYPGQDRGDLWTLYAQLGL